MKPVRFGLVGCGVMGRNHARVLSGLKNAQLVGIADPDSSAVASIAEQLEVPAVGQIDQLLDMGCDALVIAGPTHLHHELSLRAMERSVHVLVEKPIASTVEEGQDIVARARRKRVVLMVGHVERFNPVVHTVKQAIQNEDILSIAITRVGPFPPRMSHVGVVIDLAVHDIDLIRWFTGSEIDEIQPQLANAMGNRDDIALLQFRTTSGVLAHINTNWITPFKARTIQIATRKKYVVADLQTREVTECYGFQRDGSYSIRHLPVGYYEPLQAELNEFLRAVVTGTEPLITGEEAVASLRIAKQCLQEGTRRGGVVVNLAVTNR